MTDRLDDEIRAIGRNAWRHSADTVFCQLLTIARRVELLIADRDLLLQGLDQSREIIARHDERIGLVS